MIDFKRRDTLKGLLLLLLGLGLGLNAAQSLATTRQSVPAHPPRYETKGITALAHPLSQRVVTAQAAAVLFCLYGDSPQPACFTAAALARLPHTTLTVSEHNGTRIAYAGVLLRELLQQAGVPQGEQLRGANLARYLVVDGADGYAVVFGLEEFDPAFGNRVVLLADRRDGHALAADEAPLRLVIPGDQRRARWVRKITRMRVMQVTDTAK